MKNILLFLSLYLMFLLGAKAIDVSAPSEEGTGVENVLQAEASEGFILPSVADLPDKGEAYVESMAVQYRVLGRGQRSFSVQQMFFQLGMCRREQGFLYLICLFHFFFRFFYSTI